MRENMRTANDRSPAVNRPIRTLMERADENSVTTQSLTTSSLRRLFSSHAQAVSEAASSTMAVTTNDVSR